jgi:fructose-1,6-bisphosphatase/inositol monophosphatase family enzyme
MNIHTDQVIESCVKVLLKVQREALELVWQDPMRCFEPIYLENQQKPAAVVDVVAEWRAAEGLRRCLGKVNPLVIGEESLRQGFERLDTHTGLVVLLDAIDGTRLLECGWDDWCSAVTVIDGAQRRIICAVVVLPSGVSYFASPSGAGKLRSRGGTFERQTLSVPSIEPTRSKASIAFYGYRQPRFTAVGGRVANLHSGSTANPDVFVVGGNPALVRLVDGCRGIDAVVEPVGQAPHDFVAGAYICQQAGGTTMDLSGKTIDFDGLLFAGPCQKIAYIAARNPKVAEQLRSEFSEMMREARKDSEPAVGIPRRIGAA